MHVHVFTDSFIPSIGEKKKWYGIFAVLIIWNEKLGARARSEIVRKRKICSLKGLSHLSVIT